MPNHPKLIVANWKMNGSRVLATTLTRAAGAAAGKLGGGVDVVLCPPTVYLDHVHAILSGGVMLGAQDVAAAEHLSGAQTGDVSPAMLADIGCSYVIISHSERRARYGETDALVQVKAQGAIAAGLIPIICIGETAAERESGRAFDVVKTQILAGMPSAATPANTVLAYEPVWAIGTGAAADLGDILAMHRFIDQVIKESLAHLVGLRMIYGGSVKADNAASILAAPLVDGALVGGASLKPDEFSAIIRAAAL